MKLVFEAHGCVIWTSRVLPLLHRIASLSLVLRGPPACGMKYKGDKSSSLDEKDI